MADFSFSNKSKSLQSEVCRLYFLEAVPGVEHGDKGLAGPMPWRLATPPYEKVSTVYRVLREK